MNGPVRRVSTVVALLFAALFVSTTLIQVIFAPSINAISASNNARPCVMSVRRLPSIVARMLSMPSSCVSGRMLLSIAIPCALRPRLASLAFH